MAIADELIALLGFRLEGESNLRKYNQSLDKTEDKAKATAARVRKIGAAAGLMAGAAVTAGTAAMKNFANFERSMTRIGITADASAAQTAAAMEKVQKLSGEYALPLDQAVEALDTLVSSGMDLEKAMAFLPSVLATAQASGAATADIANTAIKAASALGIEAGRMQKAFDIMVIGGKAGQFELRDMSQYIPELANSFASLGYKGEEGLKELIALLQTLREDTGNAGAAATQAQNIFGKMLSEETTNRFKKFGVDIRKEMQEAKDAGESAVDAFVRISKEALDGDLSKLPLLFSDQEFRLGMQSLITSADSMEKFRAAVNGTNVEGTVFRDLNTVLDNTQSKIDRMGNAWDRMIKKIGGVVAEPFSSVFDSVSEAINRGEAIDKVLEQRGMNAFERGAYKMFYQGTQHLDDLAMEGGYEVPRAPGAPRAIGKGDKGARSPMASDQFANRFGVSDGVQSGGQEAAIQALAAKIEGMNSNLAQMTGAATVEAVVTDARQDNRQFPVSVSAPVTVNVSQPTQAPAAVGAAVGNAVGQAAVQQRSQLETAPAF